MIDIDKNNFLDFENNIYYKEVFLNTKQKQLLILVENILLLLVIVFSSLCIFTNPGALPINNYSPSKLFSNIYTVLFLFRMKKVFTSTL